MSVFFLFSLITLNEHIQNTHAMPSPGTDFLGILLFEILMIYFHILMTHKPGI